MVLVGEDTNKEEGVSLSLSKTGVGGCVLVVNRSSFDPPAGGSG
jgi:hypothetical protein